MKPRALDLFCGAGGVSVGLARVGFEVTGVDLNPKGEKYWRRGMEPYGGQFIVADATTFDLDGYDFIWASPPCQRFSVATRITGRQADHPDLVDPIRQRLKASGTLYAIENVPGAPLGGAHPLVLLCGTMFGLQTPDGRAEIRRHRWFELSWPVLFRPQCQHGGSPESLSVVEKRRAMSVAGHYPQTNLVRNQVRETFTVDDARHAMGIDWMPMRYLSQAIPPAYAEWIGRRAMEAIR